MMSCAQPMRALRLSYVRDRLRQGAAATEPRQEKAGLKRGRRCNTSHSSSALGMYDADLPVIDVIAPASDCWLVVRPRASNCSQYWSPPLLPRESILLASRNKHGLTVSGCDFVSSSGPQSNLRYL